MLRRRSGGRSRGRSAAAATLLPAMLLLAMLLGVAACGPTSSGTASPAARRAFLSAVHGQDPTVNAVRTDTQLVRLGSAACSGFSAGVSFYSLADTLAVNDGNLPASDLGTVIAAAAEHLCPRYRSRVT
jgi:hypothetical protein